MTSLPHMMTYHECGHLIYIGVLTYWCLNVDMSRRYVELYTNTCWPSERTPCLLLWPVSRCERRGPLEQSVPGPGNWTQALVAVAACVKSVFMCLLPLMCSDHFISLTLSLAWLYYPTVRKVVVGYHGYQHENKLSLIDIWTFTFGHIIV